RFVVSGRELRFPSATNVRDAEYCGSRRRDLSKGRLLRPDLRRRYAHGAAELHARRLASLTARGATPSAFERRCIPPPPQRGCRVGDPGSGCVARRSHIPDILPPRALPSGRLAALGATTNF